MHPTTQSLSFAVLMALGAGAQAAPPKMPVAPQADAGADLSASTRTLGGRAAVARALGAIQQQAATTRSNASDRFIAREVSVDSSGTEHVRFDRTYAGLPVIGGDVVMHSRNGQFKSASVALATAMRPSLVARLNASDAMVEAGVAFGPGFRSQPAVSKVIYAREVAPTLAYEVVMNGAKSDRTPTRMHYFIDARTGALLDQWDSVCTVASAGTGDTLNLGRVALTTDSVAGGGFRMRDPSRGGNSTIDFGTFQLFTDADNKWGNYTTSDRATAAADVHYGIAKTWDYYKATFGRSGIFNNGVGVESYVVPKGTNFNNAYWDGTAMYYGDGDGATYKPLVAVDITGHEMSHGVNQATAKLIYSGDAGGLNEASSDILGTMVEYYANNAGDAGDFMIGEKIFVSNPAGTKALRHMFKQDMDGSSFSCYQGKKFDPRRYLINDPHFTSGVANRFFYLLSQGAVVPAGFGSGTSYNLSKGSLVCNGNTALVGIGNAKAGAIWYRALTTYFTSTTSYPAARIATLNAARDLYGAASAEYKAVGAAWSAANVN